MRVYKILPVDAAPVGGDVVPWSDDDRRDGFMHLSTAAQMLTTAARHFAGARRLTVLEIEADELPHLRFEPSRGGELFPHLYGPLPRSAVRGALTLEPDGAGFRIVEDAG